MSALKRCGLDCGVTVMTVALARATSSSVACMQCCKPEGALLGTRPYSREHCGTAAWQVLADMGGNGSVSTPPCNMCDCMQGRTKAVPMPNCTGRPGAGRCRALCVLQV